MKIVERHVIIFLIGIYVTAIGLLIYLPFIGKGRQFTVAIDIEKLCKVDVDENEWKYVVLHHSATDEGNARRFDKHHREEKGWVNGLGYHFLIGNGNGSRDGQIEVGNRWNSQIDGAHAGKDEYNKHGVGICLIGNFENDYPTSLQISSLTYLINYLQERCSIPRNQVIMHRTFRKTACPGRLFPYNKVMASLR